MEVFYVSATHSVPKYAFRRTKVVVRYDIGSDLFYASHLELGCGKSYHTLEIAISRLFSDHGYIVTEMERCNDRA